MPTRNGGRADVNVYGARPPGAGSSAICTSDPRGSCAAARATGASWHDAAMPGPDEQRPAAARWRRLVTGRLDEMARLSPESGSVSGPFWDSRAERYGARLRVPDPAREPFLRRLLRVTGAASSVIDAGAGTGRFALALAPSVAHVTAVEPAPAMLAVLERNAAQLGVANLTTVRATWEEAAVEPADVAFSSFVVTLVPDAEPFVAKLEASAQRRVLLYLGAYCADALLDPLWRHFHAAPRTPGPTYLDALAVLRELGIEPVVKVVEIADERRFATIDEAVEHYREWLFLADTADVRRELAALLSAWLMGRRGAWRSPLRAVPAAILEWSPRGS